MPFSELDKEIRGFKADLNFILDECDFALDELHKMYSERVSLARSSKKSAYPDEYLKVFRDYLIVKIWSLFDTDSRSLSFENVFSQNKEFLNIKRQEIIRIILKYRNKTVAHWDKKFRSEKGPMAIPKICRSNLKSMLHKLRELIN